MLNIALTLENSVMLYNDVLPSTLYYLLASLNLYVMTLQYTLITSMMMMSPSWYKSTQVSMMMSYGRCLSVTSTFKKFCTLIVIL